jgi:hypothetical protein
MRPTPVPLRVVRVESWVGTPAMLSHLGVRLLVCLLFVPPHVFSNKMEGLSRATIFLAGRIMVLGELLTGQFEWGPGSH